MFVDPALPVPQVVDERHPRAVHDGACPEIPIDVDGPADATTAGLAVARDAALDGTKAIVVQIRRGSTSN